MGEALRKGYCDQVRSDHPAEHYYIRAERKSVVPHRVEIGGLRKERTRPQSQPIEQEKAGAGSAQERQKQPGVKMFMHERYPQSKRRQRRDRAQQQRGEATGSERR